ncbi:MAG: hypothetical protein ACOYL6_00590 [Bacteriovoracaceae bacterium]
MYCPTCFSNTLKLSSRGVVKLSVNGKQKETSLFLFNLVKEGPDDIRSSVKEKVEEFFRWYSTFSSPDPIKQIELYSNDYSCTNNCKIPLSTKITVIGILVAEKEIVDIATELAAKYKLNLQLKPN